MSPLLYGVLILAIVGALGGIGAKIYSSGKDAVRVEWAKANEEQRKEEAKRAAAAADQLEKERAKKKIVYRTITKQVDRYIDRPVYRNICFDADGLRDANAALAGALAPAAEPDKPVPKPDAPRGGNGSGSVAQNN